MSTDDRVGGDTVPASRTRGVTDAIARTLRHRILTNELDGAFLGNEQQLAARFGASRPSIREALRLLEGEGLVQVHVGVKGGVFAREPDTRLTTRAVSLVLGARNTEISDVIEARAHLEPLTAWGIVTLEERTSVTATLRALTRDQLGALADDAKFHMLNESYRQELARAAGNTTLTVLLETLNAIIGESEVARQTSPLRLPRARRREVRAQGRLVDLLERGDASAAEALWRGHLLSLAHAADTGPAAQRHCDDAGDVEDRAEPQ
jgi:DNA-binding FadR family transcriptional regulator